MTRENVTSNITIAHRISHVTNVVVKNQSANSKIFLLPFDWMLTTTTFVPWDILWTMVMTENLLHYIELLPVQLPSSVALPEQGIFPPMKLLLLLCFA